MRISKLSLGIVVLLLITTLLGPMAIFHSPTQGSNPSQRPPAPNFTLSLHPTNLTIVRGTVDSSNLTVTATNGFRGTITLTAMVGFNSTGILAFLPNSTVTFTSSGPTAKIVLLKVYTSITNNPEIFYNVTVTGTSGSLAHSATLALILPLANIPPVASFTFTPTIPTAGTIVTFTSTSYDPDGIIVFWQWSFGDGQVSQNASATAFHSYFSQGTYVVSLFVRDSGNQTSSTSALIQIVPKPDIPPIAQFVFSPTSPRVGVTVFFDGSTSHDPDGFITSYNWSFGDNASQFGGSFAQHTYFTAGNFTVTLTVIDNAGLSGTASARITVLPRLQHDVAVTGVFPNFNTAIQSQTVGVTVNLADYGTNNETISVSIFFNSTLVATRTNVPVFLNYFYNQVFIQFDTSNIPPGTYTVSATAVLATDQNLSNNLLRDGQVTILPGPKLTTTPTSGTLGTKVLVQGTGFATNQYGSPNQVLVTFDDMFEGFITTTTGSFNFTMDVPQAEQALHQIKAFDSTNAHSSASFTVLAQPGSLSLTITVGALYFPGDKADIYALTSLNGIPVGPSGVSLRLTATLPNGTAVTLPTSSIRSGLYKATFTVPSQLGTYALVGQASSNGSNASSLANFEAKPSWINGNGPAVLSVAGIGAAIGLVALVWRNGYFRKDQQE